MSGSTVVTPVRLNLALQGGGAHGAFTWGVLDRLLEEAWFEPEAISATSSGAMNALALAQGWSEDGRAGARHALTQLWHTVAAQSSPLTWAFPAMAGSGALLGFAKHFGPQQINPLGINPLRGIAEALFDFDRLRRGPLRLYLATTRVRDGALVLFDNALLDVDALLASACLPQFFPPVEIDGELYWDGGFAGNPVLEPLIYDGRSAELLCILVQPLTCPEPPRSATAIAERMAELAFSTTFLRELDGLRRIQRSLSGSFPLSAIGRRIKSLRFHLIEPGAFLAEHGLRTRLDTRLAFLEELCGLGRQAADDWLGRHRQMLGRGATWTG